MLLFFVEAIQGNRPELLRHAAKAYEFLAYKQRGAIGRSDYGLCKLVGSCPCSITRSINRSRTIAPVNCASI